MAGAESRLAKPAAVREQHRRERVSTRKEPRRERLEARVSREQKQLFQRAADIAGLTLTDFIISSVNTAATRALEENEAITLRARDREVFVQALMHPPAPNARLLSAAKRYREHFERDRSK